MTTPVMLAPTQNSKCTICSHPMVDAINAMLGEDVDYKDILNKIKAADPSYAIPTFASLSRHYKNHFIPANSKAVIWRNGTLCFEDGTPITYVSAINFLEGVISLAARNMLTRSHAVGIRDALFAIELLMKLRTGLDKLDDFEQAWTDLVTGKLRKRRTRKVTVEETVEEDALPADGQKALTAPIVAPVVEDEDEEIDFSKYEVDEDGNVLEVGQ